MGWRWVINIIISMNRTWQELGTRELGLLTVCVRGSSNALARANGDTVVIVVESGDGG